MLATRRILGFQKSALHIRGSLLLQQQQPVVGQQIGNIQQKNWYAKKAPPKKEVEAPPPPVKVVKKAVKKLRKKPVRKVRAPPAPYVSKEPRILSVEELSQRTPPAGLTQMKLLTWYNHHGRVAEAVEIYDTLKSSQDLSIADMCKILGTFAPRVLMYHWFAQNKDTVDMYSEVGNFRVQERHDEAMRVVSDINKALENFTGDKKKELAYLHNTILKLKLTLGPEHAASVLQALGQYRELGIEPDASTYVLILRACAMLQEVQYADKLLRTLIPPSTNPATNPYVFNVHFHNAVLDVYTEARDERAFLYFDAMLSNSVPVNAISFQTYAKACVFMNRSDRLLRMAELMRVRGILMKEISAPMRAEVTRVFSEFKQIPKEERQRIVMRRVNADNDPNEPQAFLEHIWEKWM